MKRPGSPASLLFRLIVPVCAMFILTVLAMIASVFGDPRAPVARWLDRYGGNILLVEFVATLAICLLAMAVDRIRILRNTGSDPASSATEPTNQPALPAIPPNTAPEQSENQ